MQKREKSKQRDNEWKRQVGLLPKENLENANNEKGRENNEDAENAFDTDDMSMKTASQSGSDASSYKSDWANQVEEEFRETEMAGRGTVSSWLDKNVRNGSNINKKEKHHRESK